MFVTAVKCSTIRLCHAKNTRRPHSTRHRSFVPPMGRGDTDRWMLADDDDDDGSIGVFLIEVKEEKNWNISF